MNEASFFSELRFDQVLLISSLLLLVILIPMMWLFQFKKKKPTRVKFSSLKNIKGINPSLKVRLRHLPVWLRLCSIGLLLVAFSHPYLEREKPKEEANELNTQKKNDKKKSERKKIKIPTEGISIQLLIDRSGSMDVHEQRSIFGGSNGVKVNYMKFENELMSKLDVVKIISKRFINGHGETNKNDKLFSGRGNDLIGLSTFARYPWIACPLTLRHDLLLENISQLEPVKLRENNATYIGYALERSILQVVDAKSRAKKDNAYNIKSSIIVLITDGEQVVFPEDQEDRHKSLLPSEAAQIAQEHGIKIYSIAITPNVIYDSQGTIVSQGSDFSVDEIKEAANMTGGKFYSAKDGKALLKIYKEIDRLEKSKLPTQKELEVKVEKTKEIKKKESEKIELFPSFLWLAFFLLLSEIFLSNTYFRRIP